MPKKKIQSEVCAHTTVYVNTLIASILAKIGSIAIGYTHTFFVLCVFHFLFFASALHAFFFLSLLALLFAEIFRSILLHYVHCTNMQPFEYIFPRRAIHKQFYCA